ncbi:MAG: dihydropteroate synthase [Maritimibacter sp.]
MNWSEAIARLGPRPSEALPLAGFSQVWFDTVTGTDSPDVRARLSAPRADICGLSMDQTRVMGILNVTPDSFSDGGDFLHLDAAIERAGVLARTCDIIDIGGESTRPGAKEVAVEEEIRRTAPIIAAIRAAQITTPISIDTRKSAVAEAALDAGADMVNDVSAFEFDPALADLCAARDVPVCLMHAKGLPEDMQDNPKYDDVVGEVMSYLAARIDFAVSRGISQTRIITDPGIGFGKTTEHNVQLLQHLSAFHDLGLPVLLGVSRKRFIGEIGGEDTAKDRLGGSLAVALHGAAQAMQILRVHDTKHTTQALALHRALQNYE